MGVVLGLAFWLALTNWHVVGSLKLPSLSEIGRKAADTPSLPHDIWLTLERSLFGFAIGSAGGVLVALLASWNSVARGLSEPLIQVFKPVPALVLTPFMIVWFGASNGGVISLVVWGCFFIMVVETDEALRNTPLIHQWAATTLGESHWGLQLRVLLPSSVPRLIGGLRISMVAAVNLTILGEFNVASGGLGDLIVRGYNFLQPDLMFLGVLAAVALAFALDTCVRLLRIGVRRWA